MALGDSDGDQRLIHVDRKQFSVGFIGHGSSGGAVSKLALLQQSTTNVPWVDRISDQNAANYNMDAMRYLWRPQLPPAGLRLTSHATGYWCFDFQSDISPMEALVFATCEEEASEMTTLCADIQFGGFEVRYSSLPRRTVGPRHHAMKCLRIDGRGGERISSVFLTVAHIVAGIRFVTNWGRQMVIGRPSNNERRYSSADLDGENAVLAGIFCNWGERATPKSRLDAVGVFSRTGQPSVTGENSDGNFDSHGFFWEPSPPLAPFIEAGKIWGQHDRTDRRTRNRTLRAPDEGSTICWLDCRRPLTSVRVTLCHGSSHNHIPLSAVTLQYADVVSKEACSESTVGPSCFTKPSDNEGMNGYPWCWCAYGSKRKEEMEAKSHFTQETWQPDGAKLGSLRVWLDDSRLSAIQLVSADGRESPIWGYTDGESDGVICFDAGHREDVEE